MGHHKHKGWKSRNHFKSRGEYLLSRYDPELLDVWFGDDEQKREDFGKYLVRTEVYWTEELMDQLESINEEDVYDKKMKKLMNKKLNSILDIEFQIDKIVDLAAKKKKILKKQKKKRNVDLSLATLMDSKKYRKSYLNRDDYRNYLKKEAKAERKEVSEMVRLGYIKSKDPDKELKKLLNENPVFSDTYIQKHFL